MDASENVIAEY